VEAARGGLSPPLPIDPVRCRLFCEIRRIRVDGAPGRENGGGRSFKHAIYTGVTNRVGSPPQIQEVENAAVFRVFCASSAVTVRVDSNR
jgi:hypothetical protein